MITKYVRYRVQPDKVADTNVAIAAFLAGIRQQEPGTLFYEAYQEQEDVTRFVHFMGFRDADAESFHRATGHVQAFVEALYPTCVEPPVFVDLEAVDIVRHAR